MIRTIALPTPQYVGWLVGGLLDRQVVVERADEQPFDPQAPGQAGVYAKDDGGVAALCCWDLHLAAYAAAALTLVPPGTAADAVRARELPEFLADNACEVLNVCGRLFNSPRTPHVALQAVHILPGMLPSDAALLLRNAAGRLELTAEIPGYGAGRLWLACA
jgi:hypothetical protein